MLMKLSLMCVAASGCVRLHCGGPESAAAPHHCEVVELESVGSHGDGEKRS